MKVLYIKGWKKETLLLYNYGFCINVLFWASQNISSRPPKG